MDNALYALRALCRPVRRTPRTRASTHHPHELTLCERKRRQRTLEWRARLGPPLLTVEGRFLFCGERMGERMGTSGVEKARAGSFTAAVSCSQRLSSSRSAVRLLNRAVTPSTVRRWNPSGVDRPLVPGGFCRAFSASSSGPPCWNADLGLHCLSCSRGGAPTHTK
jgi:hypothetical protein